MNKCSISFGYPIKVKLRKHYCYKCCNKLMVVKHRKVVYKELDEAKYYAFDTGDDGGIM